MNRAGWFAFLMIAGAWAVSGGQARRGAIYGGVGQPGQYIRISTFCEPDCSTGSNFNTSSISSKNNGCHRYFVDEKNGTYFGYDLDVENVPETGKFIVSIKPLSLAPSEVSRKEQQTLAPISLARYPGPQTLSEGDLFLLDVLVNRKTGQKIVDEIGVSATEAGPDELDDQAHNEPPRDFNLSDVELRVTGPTLVVNGKVVSQLNQKSSATGHVIYFYKPEFGRVIFSVEPEPGMQKAGTLHRKTMEFTLGNDKYEWRSTTPVLPGAGPFNLYVLQDFNYTPRNSRIPSAVHDPTYLQWGSAASAAALLGDR